MGSPETSRPRLSLRVCGGDLRVAHGAPQDVLLLVDGVPNLVQLLAVVGRQSGVALLLQGADLLLDRGPVDGDDAVGVAVDAELVRQENDELLLLQCRDPGDVRELLGEHLAQLPRSHLLDFLEVHPLLPRTGVPWPASSWAEGGV